jgi:hypothetical protein
MLLPFGVTCCFCGYFPFVGLCTKTCRLLEQDHPLTGRPGREEQEATGEPYELNPRNAKLLPGKEPLQNKADASKE